MDPKCPYSSKRAAMRSKEEEGEGSRERFEDDFGDRERGHDSRDAWNTFYLVCSMSWN